jgi:hypothetical protein
MLIGIENSSIGLEARIIEPNINREASNYILNNWQELHTSIKKKLIKSDKAHDLLSDVYISIIEAENNGNGFDMEYGSNVDENGNINFNIMSVEQFVLGRIKLYSKNTKYNSDIVESANGYVYETVVYETPEIDEHGQEIIGSNGKVKTTKKTERVKVDTMITTCAASFNEGGEFANENDDLQKEYARAATADFSEDLTEMMSLRENIDYCIDVCELHHVNLLNVLKNIDSLSEMLGDYSRKKKSAEDVFKKLSDIVAYNDEFANTLMEVLKYSSRNRAAFESVIATY